MQYTCNPNDGFATYGQVQEGADREHAACRAGRRDRVERLRFGHLGDHKDPEVAAEPHVVPLRVHLEIGEDHVEFQGGAYQSENDEP